MEFDRMNGMDGAKAMSVEEIAWEFAGVFDELDAGQMNEMLSKNVPLATLDFFSEYAERFARAERVEASTSRRLPNLLLIGYLLRLLEERLIEQEEPTH